MILIDAHGPDHGLYIEVDIKYSHEVTIKQWGEYYEPDEHGSHSPHLQEATVPLRKLLDRAAPHYKSAGPTGKSMHDRIANLATTWLDYWGGDVNYVSDADRPCQHFGMNYSGVGARRVEPWPDHMTCAACGGKPE